MNPNPKSVNDLDPKLKEVYERVMGTNFAPNGQNQQAPALQTASPKTESQPAPTPAPVQTPNIQQTAPSPAQPIQPAPVSIPEPTFSSDDNSQIFKAGDPFKEADPPPPDVIVNSSAPTPTVVKKSHRISPLIFVLGGIVFFVAYAVVWAKVFGLF